MSEERTSPRPWELERYEASDSCDIHAPGIPHAIATVHSETNHADARLIVKAVNFHSELVAALKAALDRCRCIDNLFGQCDSCDTARALLARLREGM